MATVVVWRHPIQVVSDMAKRRKVRGLTKGGGELPGEYLRRSLVAVSTGLLSDGGRIKEDHYIVKTTRLDGIWRIVVEHGAEGIELPHKVAEQIARHRESISKAQRHDKAVQRDQQMG